MLTEYQQKGRVSQFVDKRFGEDDPNMGDEEKMVARFAAERKKLASKNKFNLEDDEEELTHLGQSLSTIDDYDNIGLNEDEDDEDEELSRNTKLAHFGVGSGMDGPEERDDSEPKTKREIMQEIIAKSKQMKAERQKTKIEDEELMEQLDKDFREIQSLIISSGPSEKVIPEETEATQNYEAIIHELATERRAKPTDRLKTDLEIAKEEKERLDALEVILPFIFSFSY